LVPPTLPEQFIRASLLTEIKPCLIWLEQMLLD